MLPVAVDPVASAPDPSSAFVCPARPVITGSRYRPQLSVCYMRIEFSPISTSLLPSVAKCSHAAQPRLQIADMVFLVPHAASHALLNSDSPTTFRSSLRYCSGPRYYRRCFSLVNAVLLMGQHTLFTTTPVTFPHYSVSFWPPACLCSLLLLIMRRFPDPALLHTRYVPPARAFPVGEAHLQLGRS